LFEIDWAGDTKVAEDILEAMKSLEFCRNAVGASCNSFRNQEKFGRRATRR
jgi:hypothetical protein